MKIPFFDYPALFESNKDEYIQIFKDICMRGAFIMQKEVSEFENNLSKYVNSKYAVGVGNATDGLELCCQSIGLKSGDEVICSSHTMLATASSIIISGGTPVPVEIGDDGLIDPSAIEDAINPRTVGIMPTQLNGRTCNMDKIMQIADKNHLFVIEDAAQALGSRFRGKYAGTFGNSSAISFYPAKTLGCFGDAGAVLTNNDELYHKLYQLHDHGRDKNGEVKSWGRNSRLDNLQAAFLNFKFKSYDDVIKRRRDIAAQYDKELRDLEELILPPAPTKDGDNFDVYQNYEIQANERDRLKKYLSDKGIGTLIQWGGKGIHQWQNLGFSITLPKVEKFFEKCLMLPMNMFVTDKEIKYICDNLKKFYRN